MVYDIEVAIAGARASAAYMAERNIRGGWVNAVLVDRALARGLSVEPDARRRVSLSDGRQRHWFNAGNSSMNRAMARRCAHHKEVTSATLRAQGVFAPQNLVFEAGEAARAWGWVKPVLPAVLKPQSAKSGTMVYVGVAEVIAFHEAFNAIAAEYGRVLVEQYVPGIEHRVLMIGGRVVAVARRVPAHVVGDGRSDVASLVEQKNADRLAAANPLHNEIKLDDMVMRELQKDKMTLASVPRLGQLVSLRATSNVHTGGDVVDATDEISSEETQFAESAARALPGLYMGGFDVLLARDGKGSEPCVIEVNASPVIAMHHFPARGQIRDVAGELLSAMFGDHGGSA